MIQELVRLRNERQVLVAQIKNQRHEFSSRLAELRDQNQDIISEFVSMEA